MLCLDLPALNFIKLVDFDVNTLAKKLKPHVDELADYVREIGNNKGDEISDDDSEDADFNEVEQEHSFNSDKGFDDMELEFDAESKMSFGREIIHGESDRNLVVNKKSTVFNKGVLWSRNRDESGIIIALNKIMPIARRRVCVIHLYKNFASSYLGNKYLYPIAWFHAYFYIAINAYSAYVHEKAIEQIKEKDATAYHWLRDTESLKHWARFKFDHILKHPNNTNNFVESFNHATLILGPIFIMLEDIRKLVGGRSVKRFEKA
ncbi:LOW QUALITY PROTEIN: hypothetical protein Cgig2_023856 [Carnegiea gigantea]|uniref:Uncharacterized protein n=1 Tax=Carnegiea gigantea TaxID=171969 RepID=A0A9Q1GLA8_9CARY|nr:LOW QUALITY PROTEIN: hypothetical protein Cgig2_023856 [Carnegiea gigantea]